MDLQRGYRRWGDLGLALLALAVVLLTLFWGENIGLSDSGDFERVMLASHLDFLETDKSFRYVENYAITLTESSALGNIGEILFSTENLAICPSIHVALVRVSVVLCLAVNFLTGSEMAVFHLDVLGVLYSLLYAGALFWLFRHIRLKRVWADILAKLVLIVVLCDVGYTAYFNSLYGEALQIVSFVFLAGCALRILGREKPALPDMLLLAVGAVVYGWSKFFNIPAAILLAAALSLAAYWKSRRWKLFIPAAGAALLLAVVYFLVPAWMDDQTAYNAVFYGIVKDVDADTGRAYLRELGLPEEMIEFCDTNYYSYGVQDALAASGYEEAMQNVSKLDLLLFYCRHPALLLDMTEMAIAHSGFIRPYYLANYGEGVPRGTLSGRFALWSSIRAAVGFDTALGTAGVLLAFAAAVLLLLGRRRETGAILLAFLATAAYCLVVPPIANGEADLAKHMFAFAQLIDAAVLTVLLAAINALTSPALAARRRCRESLPAAVLIAALLLQPAAAAMQGLVQARSSHDSLEAGAYLQLGTWEGEPLLWLVTEVSEGRAALLCMTDLGEMPFDEDNSSYWPESSLRAWLNGAFLSTAFTEEERAALLETEHDFLLSVGRRESAERGDRDFYCFHIPAYAARGYDRAYAATAADVVALPDIRLACALLTEDVDIGADFWLETAYYSNDSMVRYVAPGGYLYFRDASECMGVRPVVTLSLEALSLTSGAGSRQTPFTFS